MRHFLPILILLFLTNCAGLELPRATTNIPPTSTQSTLAQTVTPTQTLASSSTAITPTPARTVTPTQILAPSPNAITPTTAQITSTAALEILPLDQAQALKLPVNYSNGARLNAWSPHGDLFVYEEFSNGSRHLVARQAAISKTCLLPELTASPNPYHLGSDFAWLPDGQMMIIDKEESVLLGVPCQGDWNDIASRFTVLPTSITSVSPDYANILLETEDEFFIYRLANDMLVTVPLTEFDRMDAPPSWSPNEEYVLLTGTLAADQGAPLPGYYESLTWVVEVATGRIVDETQWRSPGGLGFGPSPDWISPTQFVLPRTYDQGPQLVTIGQGHESIVEHLFGLEIENLCQRRDEGLHCEDVLARGMLLEEGHYLVTLEFGEPDSETQIRVYDSRHEEIFIWSSVSELSFSPDGEWAFSHNEVDGSLLLQSVEGKALLIADAAGPIAWSPDAQHLAISHGSEMRILTLSDGSIVRAITLDGEVMQFAWSPEGTSLLVIAEGGNGQSLYLISSEMLRD